MSKTKGVLFGRGQEKEIGLVPKKA